jgi:DNA-binding PadR family transcriptional regulator
MKGSLDFDFAGVGAGRLPAWLPMGVRHYIDHTESGRPIRALARQAGCHASTVLRQIRRVETRRDDPLVDAALRHLGAAEAVTERKSLQPAPPGLPDDVKLRREAVRVLRRLCEKGAVLAVAAEMDKAVVVREGTGDNATRTAVVEASVAQAMALNDWIAASGSGRIKRYQITAAGRAALAEMMGEGDPGPGCAEAPAEFDMSGETCRRSRYSLSESPLAALARRRDRSGKAFLGSALVRAGERLREDFELAQMGPRVTQNWDHYLAPGSGGQGSGGSDASARARARVAGAMADLGPGLSDVVLRCCCHLEGLETAEKRLGWSARSGKVVLRIALMRLKRYYDETAGPGGALIG